MKNAKGPESGPFLFAVCRLSLGSRKGVILGEYSAS